MAKTVWELEDQPELLKALKIKLFQEDEDHCDGDRTCRAKAAFVAPSVQAYIKRVREDTMLDALSDMLADMMHLVDLLNAGVAEDDRVTFDELVDRAENHHSAEVSGEKETRKYYAEQEAKK